MKVFLNNMAAPFISVLMSTYNGETFLKESIESILNQTYDKIKLLLLDDGSTDGTYEIYKDYSQIDNRIEVFKNDINLGLTKSLNKLISQTNTNFIARQDADDVSDINRLEKQINFLEKNNLDACSTRAFIKETKKVTPSKSFYISPKIAMQFKNPFVHGTLLIKREVLQEVGSYDENFYYSQDYKLMSDLLMRNYKVKILKEPLYILNMKGNISVNKKEQQKYYAECVRKNIVPNELNI